MKLTQLIYIFGLGLAITSCSCSADEEAHKADSLARNDTTVNLATESTQNLGQATSGDVINYTANEEIQCDNQPIVMLFTSTDMPELTKALNDVAKELKGKATFMQVDSASNPTTANQFIQDVLPQLTVLGSDGTTVNNNGNITAENLRPLIVEWVK